MSRSNDRRLWSTTPKRLSAFVEALRDTGIPSTSVRNLQMAFREHRFYPARDLSQFCIPEPPDVFFSYYSAQNYVDIQEIVWNAMDFAARHLRESSPELAGEDLEPWIQDGVRLWVDFMFIDQAARDLREELEILSSLIRGCDAHFVLGSQPLMRSWCCYEIALFNQDLAETDEPEMPGAVGPGLRSFIAPTRSFYVGWEKTETSEPEDKRFIQERIESTFPGGFDGFHQIMSQANSVAVLPLVEGGEWTTPAADEELQRSAAKWHARWRSGKP